MKKVASFILKRGDFLLRGVLITGSISLHRWPLGIFSFLLVCSVFLCLKSPQQQSKVVMQSCLACNSLWQ